MSISKIKTLKKAVPHSVHIRSINSGFVLINKKTNLPELKKIFKDKEAASQYCDKNHLKITTISKFARSCSKCGSGMNEGFCIKGGEAYYCSDECLYKCMSKKEYQELYDSEDDDTYYSTWSVAGDGMADE